MIARGSTCTLSCVELIPSAPATELLLRDSAAFASGVPIFSTVSVAATPDTVGSPRLSSASLTESSDDSSLMFTAGGTSRSAIDCSVVDSIAFMIVKDMYRDV